MFSFTVRATAILVMALAFLVLSPGRPASAAPVMVNGQWGSVFSTDAPLLNAGDCQGGIEGTGLSRNSPAAIPGPWNCEDANHNPLASNGTLNATLSGVDQINGTIAFTGPGCAFTTTFRGTLSTDGKSISPGTTPLPTWSSPVPECGAQCAAGNVVDEDVDGFVNDGCPQVGATPETPGPQCADAINNDFADDGVVNDGCPAVASTSQHGTFEAALQTNTTSPATVTAPNAGPGVGANLTFAGSATTGYTAIITAPTGGGPLPPNFMLVGQYYHVITTVPGTGTAGGGPYIFCAGYVEDIGGPGLVGGAPEGGLQIWHFESGGFTPKNRHDGGSPPPFSDTNNTGPTANTVCAQVDFLSEFALVAPVTSVGGLVSIVAGDSSSGVNTWLLAASIAGVIALATAGGWMVLERRRLH